MTTRRISIATFMENRSMNKYYSRKWLNKKEGTAFMECSFEPAFGTHHDCSFKLADCNRMVNIDFGFYDKKGKVERIAKLSSIIDELLELKKLMEKVEMKK